MKLSVECPDCGRSYHVAEEKLGSRARCSNCSSTFTLAVSADETVRPEAKPASASGEGRPLPKTIGHYVIKKTIGAGAMGEVYLAHDPELDRDVAIKLLPATFAHDEERLKRFLREARSAAKLHHTNVVTVYQAGSEGDRPFIAMELVDGGSLEDAISADGPMDWREATGVIRDAAAGLAVAHEMGLVHRDVKPANLMRTRTGVTKVADFGLARAQLVQTELTREGTAIGTPAYMSAEQWMGAKVDGRSDLYSLICTYYALLTGGPPYDEAAFAALGYLHAHEPFPDPRAKVPQLADGVCRIIARGSIKDPDKRYQSAAELIAQLDALLALPQESLTSTSSWEALVASSGTESGPPQAAHRAHVWSGRVAATVKSISGTGRRLLTQAAGWLRTPVGVTVAAVGGIAALLMGIVLYVSSNYGMVKIELSDPSASVEVQVDGDTVEIAGLKEPLRIKVGQHDLLVTSGDFETYTDSFTVKRGQKELVRVSLVAKPTPAAAHEPAEEAAPAATPPSQSTVDVSRPNKEITLDLDGGVTLELVLIPAGSFMMGSPDSDADALPREKPLHEVTITKPFYLGKYEVTQEQWEAVMGSNPSNFKEPKKPVEMVNWDDCQVFIVKLNEKHGASGGKFSLPTEAQWEYACRAGSTTRFSFGDDEAGLGEHAWFISNSGMTTHPVGLKKPNAWGLYDMHGNVVEWCRDWHDVDYYANSPVDDPSGPTTGASRVWRGGSWGIDNAHYFRCADRSLSAPDFRHRGVGFRVSRTVYQHEPAEEAAPAEMPPPAVAPAAPPQDEKPSVKSDTVPVATPPQSTVDASRPNKEITLDLGGGVTLELVQIPAGSFMMGSADSDPDASDNEKPPHEVTITRPFYLGKYEVTQEQWEAVMGSNPSNRHKEPKWPVANVNWDDCQVFIVKLNEKHGASGGKFSLPTEAQWEYACRAGSTTRFSFGDDEAGLGEHAWFDGNREGTTHPVGLKKPNAWGLCDMHGNVLEWCRDWHDGDYYANSPVDDPSGPTTGAMRVLRGGSWFSVGTGDFRCAYRNLNDPDFGFIYYGFRVSRTVYQHDP